MVMILPIVNVDTSGYGSKLDCPKEEASWWISWNQLNQPVVPHNAAAAAEVSKIGNRKRRGWLL